MGIFGYGMKELGAAVLLSGAVAALVAGIANASAANKPLGGTISVNRINKGDRLPQAAPVRQPSSSLYRLKTAAPVPAPLGCDPAFSPVAAPSHAQVFLRCLS